MATIGIAWSSRNVQSSPGGGGVGGPCSIVTLYASRSLRVSAASAGRPEPLALATLREEPLGKIYAFREFRHLPAQVLQRRGKLFLPRLVRGARLAPRLQLGSVRFGEGPDDHQGEKPADGDDGDERSEEHTSELQSLAYLVCRLLLEKKKDILNTTGRVRHYVHTSPPLRPRKTHDH